MMNTHAGIILQARLGSTRLPGKALARIGSLTILEHCLARLQAGGAGEVVLATTDRREDDVLASLGRAAGARVFRGNAEDVLERIASAVARFGYEHVVRATADNPGVDIECAGRLLLALQEYGADYAIEAGLPYGSTVEAMTRDALFRAAAGADRADDREHVTPYIRRRLDEFHVVQLAAPPGLRRPELRLTVDTREDLSYMRELYRRTSQDLPSLQALIAAADAGLRLDEAA